jgi:hypothetical protein
LYPNPARGRLNKEGSMSTYYVHDRQKDTDYIVVPGKTVLRVTPKIMSDFLYAADFSKRKSDLSPGQPEDFGEVLENNQLRIRNSDLWAERKAALE